ncbi:hypothetical protein D7S81_17720 [Ralstonia insidiosa]|nr:hypothetical protein [Ralstonia insidiosa]MBA9938447.1 hypothetical protein [Ralstonia insidiosa]
MGGLRGGGNVVREHRKPTAQPDLGPAMLAVPMYGCASRANLGLLATVFGTPEKQHGAQHALGQKARQIYY